MRYDLTCHPESAPLDGLKLSTTLKRLGASGLALTFDVRGEISNLDLAPVGAPERGDELWLNTCFEIFIKNKNESAYFEFNFSPTGQWAIYHFNDYRNGMRIEEHLSPSQINDKRSGDHYQLNVVLRDLPLYELKDIEVGLSAIIKTSEGETSYWALAHPAGKPDFHHSDCFAGHLPLET